MTNAVSNSYLYYNHSKLSVGVFEYIPSSLYSVEDIVLSGSDSDGIIYIVTFKILSSIASM